MTVYGYLRVSSSAQTIENQRFYINQYIGGKKEQISQWGEETVSSRKPLESRKLGNLLHKAKNKDKIIVSEISRLARNLYELAGILQLAVNRGVEIISVKENYVFDDSLQSKIMCYTFGLAAEIERDLISARTKMSLDKLRENNVKLGRPFGAKSKSLKLSKNRMKIRKMLQEGYSRVKIAAEMNVDVTTIYRFLKRENINLQPA